jgi:hypothetical protein
MKGREEGKERDRVGKGEPIWLLSIIREIKVFDRLVKKFP